jgi:peptidase S41-like protein
MSRLRLVGVIACLVSAMLPLHSQTATPPDTPAGRVLRAWLEAFNTGDSARMEEFYRRYQPDVSAANTLGFRRQTAGFDLLTIERSEPRHVEFTVKERAPRGWSAFGAIDLTSTEPASVVNFPLLSLGAGGTAAKLAIDGAARASAIDGAIAQLAEYYVFPEVAKQIADSLHARQKRGAYDHSTNGIMFAQTLNDEVRAISHDKHMRVNYSVNPLPPAPTGPPPSPSPEMRARMQQQMDAQNCGFVKAEQLDGNIGYVKFNFFADPDLCGPTASAAMNFVAGTRALIVDMRDNTGGSPAMVSYVASYLFNDSTHLNDLWDRKSGKTTEYWTRPSVPGRKFGGDKPVYVLTSSRTFSGGEEYTYDLKSIKRATIVGETTGGGAHPVAGRRIDDHFMIGVPGARAINPITHTNWEGVGVEPDVKVSAAEALNTAKKLAAEKLKP